MPIILYKEQTRPTQINTSGIAGRNVPVGLLAEEQGRQTETVTKAMTNILGLVAEENRRQHEMEAFEAYNQLQQDILSYESAYASEYKGKNAKNAASDFQTFALKRAGELESTLSGVGLQAFSRQAQTAGLGSFSRGSSYATTQKTAYQESVFKGMRATHSQLVADNPHDFARIAQSRAVLNEVMDTFMPGMDHTSIRAELDKEDATQMINSALANGNVKQAATLYDELSSKLGDGAPAMQVRIASFQESEAKRLAVAEEKASQARYNASINNTYAAIQDRINGLPEADQDILVFHLLDGMENQKMRDDLLDRYEKDKKFNQMRQDAVDEKERSAIFADGTLSPSQRIDAINANESMSFAAKDEAVKALKAGPAQSDLYQFETMEERIYSPDCQYETVGELRRAMDPLQLTNQDKDTLVSMYTTLQKKEKDDGASIVKQAIQNADMTMEALGVDKQNMSAVKMAFVQQIALLEKEGAKLDQSELDRLMRQLVATKSTGKPGALWGTEQAVIGTAIVDVPFDVQRGIREYLYGIGITSEEITPDRVLQEWNRRGMEDFRGVE